jgi:hypothetical protein
MKIIVTHWSKDWRGKDPQPVRPAMLDLAQERQLLVLLVSLGNGSYDEICIEVDSTEAHEWVRGALTGTGGAARIEPTAEAASCRLFRAGYEVYSRGDDAFYFLNPRARPELFSSTSDLAAYAGGFSGPEEG